GRSASGIRTTSGAYPSAASATHAWCRAAPQLVIIMRPSGSLSTSWRDGSAKRSAAPSWTRQCHGWVVLIEGATAAATAALVSAWSAVVVGTVVVFMAHLLARA